MVEQLCGTDFTLFHHVSVQGQRSVLGSNLGLTLVELSYNEGSPTNTQVD